MATDSSHISTSTTQSSDMRKYNAVVLGATGATGKALVRELLQAEKWDKITTIGRRAVKDDVFSDISDASSRLHQIVTDTDKNQYNDVKSSFANNDAVFCCLGTTIKQAGSDENFKKIDLHLVHNGGENASAASVPHFSLLTSSSASTDSWFLYTRTKGEAEEAIKALNFKSIGIFRPSLLMTDREESRPMEALARSVFPKISWMLPRGAKEIKVESVAKVMRIDAEHQLERYISSSSSSSSSASSSAEPTPNKCNIIEYNNTDLLDVIKK
eukprot:TRINITY_DN3807_c0_g1_i1.p1 TRINITY_DN3807_c0_g1~~TRINITY_DN3807_c0_g1_i1.p1  ORF type:complete len:271 (-),score=75.70 TRINITY_DN3807_c0_g1_i1:468-1280(-)